MILFQQRLSTPKRVEKTSRRPSKGKRVNKFSQLTKAMVSMDEDFYDEIERFNTLLKASVSGKKGCDSYTVIDEIATLQQRLISQIRACIPNPEITNFDIMEHLTNYCKISDSHHKCVEDTNLFLEEIFPDLDSRNYVMDIMASCL